MPSTAKPAVPGIFWFMLAFLLFIGWQAGSEFREMHRPLTGYQRLTGQLRTARMVLTHGKGAHWYLQFTLAGAEQPFGFRDQGQAMLNQLTPLLNGPDLTIYYGSPRLFNDVNLNVAQLEAPGQLLYSLDSTHRKAASSFTWLLLLLAVALPIFLKLYLNYLADRRADNL